MSWGDWLCYGWVALAGGYVTVILWHDRRKGGWR